MKKINEASAAGGDESLPILFQGIVPRPAAGQRLDAFLAEAVAGQGISRGKVQELIREGLAKLNGKVAGKPNMRLGGGEAIELSGRVVPTALQAGEEGVRVLWRDASLAVVDKPAGLTTHPAPGLDEETLVHRLLHDFPELSGQEGERPGIVHRLDKDTSGLILAALTERARLKLSEAFARRTTGKVYLALTHGVPKPASGSIDAPVGRDPGSRTRMAVLRKGGREALSDYAVLWSSPDTHCALVAVRIHTGRTHQIRVHLTHIGHPLWGDAVYGPRQYAETRRADPALGRLAQRQMLHAFAISFPHPEDGRVMRFLAPPHKDFQRLPLHLMRRCQRVAVVGLPGAGKSAFCERLAARGVPVFSADAAVAAEYAPGGDGWLLLRGRFGSRFVPGDDAPVDRQALFAAMREEPAVRREVEEMIHPRVRHRLDLFWKEHGRVRVAVAEVPLFLEKGWRDGADSVVCVSASTETRRTRLAARGVSAETAAWLESWQWAEADKIKASAVVARNDAEHAALDREAVRVLAALKGLRRASVRKLWAELGAFWRGEGVAFLSELGFDPPCEKSS